MRQHQYYKELEKNHNWNAWMNVLDASFFAVAFTCILPAVAIVAYLKHYTDSKIILNLPVFIANFAFAFMPFVASFFSGRIQRKKRAMLISGFFHRLSWIPVILTVFFLSGNKELLLPVFFLCYVVFYLVWGSTGIFWREMIGRTLHPDRLSSAMGLRESISSVIGFLTSLGVMYILATMVFPRNFQTLFVLAFVSLAGSYFWLTRMREATYTRTSQEKPARHLANILSLPKRDPVFRWYLIYLVFAYGTMFIGGLYTAVGIDRFGDQLNGDRLAGIITTLTMFSVSLFAMVIGRIYDRAGKFWGFLPVVVCATLLPLWAMFSSSLYAYLGMFLMVGIMWNGWILELATVLSFSEPERRHEYIAATGLVKVFPIVVYTNLGGYLADRFSPALTFGLSSVFCFTGLCILVFKLRPYWSKPAVAGVVE